MRIDPTRNEFVADVDDEQRSACETQYENAFRCASAIQHDDDEIVRRRLLLLLLLSFLFAFVLSLFIRRCTSERLIIIELVRFRACQQFPLLDVRRRRRETSLNKCHRRSIVRLSTKRNSACRMIIIQLTLDQFDQFVGWK